MQSVARSEVGITTALIYTRVSSDEQAGEGISPAEQLTTCRQYAARQSWSIGAEYTDALSGMRDDRREYLAMLAEARRLRSEGRPVAVVVKRLDRLGRRLLERVRCREELRPLNVPIHSVAEGGEQSDLVFNIWASDAQEEVRQLGERVADARRHVAGNGWKPVGSCAWGYRWRPATDEERRQGAPNSVLEVDSVAAPYVVTAFEMTAGEALRAAASKLGSDAAA
jgi:DNA invertase Pin-like site-specific DNA recombinase